MGDGGVTLSKKTLCFSIDVALLKSALRGLQKLEGLQAKRAMEASPFSFFKRYLSL